MTRGDTMWMPTRAEHEDNEPDRRLPDGAGFVLALPAMLAMWAVVIVLVLAALAVFA